MTRVAAVACHGYGTTLREFLPRAWALALILGSAANSVVVSPGVEDDALAEWREAGAAVHLAFDRTIRRWLKAWAERGIGEQVHALALRAYDQMIGLELADVAVDGCITKAPCGGDCAGPSPGDRRKGGLKRSVATEDYGIPLGITAAGANRHDSRLLAPTLQAAADQLDGVLPDQRACQLDAGYDSGPTRQTLAEAGFTGQIAHKGTPAPSRPTGAGP